MKLVDRLLRLSATDLANHLGCAHLSRLNRALAEGRARKPRWNDPLGELLTERGIEHEKAYLAYLRNAGVEVIEIRADGIEDGAAKTIAAMRAGAPMIYQASLGNNRWFGRADFLRRVDTASALGGWSYEVIDAKLATETRAGTVLQLYVYSELLEGMQGEWPETAWVVAPHHNFEPEPHRLADYGAYCRLVKRRLDEALEAAPALAAAPDPVQQCEICAWWLRCEAERRSADHLSYVAGISRLQIKELRRFDVDTLERLGELRDVPRPSRGSRDALIRTRDQAAIQLEGRRANAPLHEILAPLGPTHGLAMLPEPSPHDIFLDLEGDRLAAHGGREYLFGYLKGTGPGTQRYVPVWAADPAAEKRAFEQLVDTILGTFREHPETHVYHFGAYEPAAFKRLAGRYATRETELDTILRAELFVDLHTIVRHGLRASVESYSIKDLEVFYGLHREQDLREATASRRAIEWAIEMREDLGVGASAGDARHSAFASNGPQPVVPPQLELGFDSAGPAPPLSTGPSAEIMEHVAAVERYNREDCVSAEKLRDWLETLRTEAERTHGTELPRPELKSGEASENIEETAEETRRVMAQLLDGVPVDPERRSPEEHARWLMAHLLEWHRREEKAAWWEFFRLRDLPLEDYEDERSALAGLELVGTVGGTARRPVHRYSFPPQDHDIRKRDKVCIPPDGTSIGEIVDIDVGAHSVDIQHGGKHADERPGRVFVHRKVPPGQQPAALLEIGRWIVAHGVDAHGPYRAARDLLLRNRPRLVAGSSGLSAEAAEGGAARDAGNRVVSIGAARSARDLRKALAADDASAGDPEIVTARRLGFELDHGVLPIQGPPGTGKTFTGSHMILALLQAGKKVGVTAVSHEAIRNLMKGVCARAAEQGLEGFECLHKGAAKDDDPAALLSTEDNDEAARFFSASSRALLGGTAWLWARPEFRQSADVLFIDEAGQMSLADVLAVSSGASSLVLLGDPQQLEQPQQASHPLGTQASALEHILDGAKTIPADRGMFLHQTRRLHPKICEFTAEVFYDQRLSSDPGLERQAIVGAPGTRAAALGDAGLVYVPVEHDGRQSRAEEEVEAIAGLVAELTSGAATWRDRDGRETTLARADLMVVAPYNAQVTALAAALPGVRVGTVDKFQGQQAPVVIVSLTTSTAEEAPRGMDFLYSANRLNVATSRAKALCILVGNPKLFEPDCRTPAQMRLANAFCRYLELARVVAPPSRRA